MTRAILNVDGYMVGPPAVGSVVYCGLGIRAFFHSGIYVGEERIVELHGSGEVRAVSPEQFTPDALIGWALIARVAAFIVAPIPAAVAVVGFTAPFDSMKIHVSCRGHRAARSDGVASRARSKIGQRRPYSFLKYNCHHFTYECLTGRRIKTARFLPAVMEQAANRPLEADAWPIWRRD